MLNTPHTRRRIQAATLCWLGTLTLRLAVAQSPICQDDAFGRTCLAAPAQRVAALENRHIENLLAVGLQPIAVSGKAAYARAYAAISPTLGAEVVDLGLAANPNLERMLTLQPDLIVGNARTVQKYHAVLRTIAPVLAFEVYPAEGGSQFDNMVDMFKADALAVGRLPQALAFMARLEAQLQDARQALAQAGWGGQTVVLANINAGITGADVMLFNSNSTPAELLRRMGLQYGYDDARHRQKAFNVTTVEALVPLQHVHLLYMPFNAAGVDKLMQSSVWRRLDFVEQSHVHALPYRQMYAGPMTAQAFIEDVLAVLLREPR
ncbi:hypothetical protein D8I35_06585 [Corticibacter populi]|uniref:Fe/B12 periplasmic-binding domain-containing protein n=1 Tax=Corticibacter populi TaxID=1550736 RepID=A0A3M6R0I0_9BURK|nr:ABC transporter substrate-binding protein [Corticibacter populi]RMX08711.1 hypothetical protein D8I35_06585 [Corticibacter populi]RZS36060.1 ABC-type Fe3+-hydroxamate transport system substrate-binding protein [Corticibacter populi]